MKRAPRLRAVAEVVLSELAAVVVAAGMAAVAAGDMAVAVVVIATVADMAAGTAAVVAGRGANRVIRLFQALDAPIYRQGRL
jgi:hypothetical protein